MPGNATARPSRTRNKEFVVTRIPIALPTATFFPRVRQYEKMELPRPLMQHHKFLMELTRSLMELPKCLMELPRSLMEPPECLMVMSLFIMELSQSLMVHPAFQMTGISPRRKPFRPRTPDSEFPQGGTGCSQPVSQSDKRYREQARSLLRLRRTGCEQPVPPARIPKLRRAGALPSRATPGSAKSAKGDSAKSGWRGTTIWRAA